MTGASVVRHPWSRHSVKCMEGMESRSHDLFLTLDLTLSNDEIIAVVVLVTSN